MFLNLVFWKVETENVVLSQFNCTHSGIMFPIQLSSPAIPQAHEINYYSCLVFHS